MTATTGSAKKVAEQYVRAWLGGDVDKAMGFIADDIICQAPYGPITGKEGYRQFLEPFASSLAGGELVDVLGDDEHVATVYTVQTPFAKDFRGMEYLTVADGKITHATSVFDLSPAIKAGFSPQS
ncbi:nuclear transport factor 2 family protein [Streptomyces sp. NPDC026672]|uniref:nuclear transport factor 2 family protein n=1 Tax=unclassified Streptomyces TaxID=2593676 RepID=UPI0033E63DF4